MKTGLKKKVAMGLVMVLLLMCSTVFAFAEEPKEIIFCGVGSGGAAWGPLEEGFMAACEDLGWNGQYITPAVANDVPALVNLIETAITNNADGIGTLIGDAALYEDVLNKAKDAGIPVVSVNSFGDESLQLCWIGTDPDGMGESQANAVLDRFEGENITAVYVQLGLDVPTQNQQFEKFSEVIKEKYPDAVLVQETCNSDSSIAADKLSAMKLSYPELNVIVCADAYASIGAANFISAEGLQEEIIAIGIDDGEETLGYVKEGLLDCTIAQDFYTMGYEAVQFMKDYFEGVTPEFANDSGTIVIGPDDVDSYRK